MTTDLEPYFDAVCTLLASCWGKPNAVTLQQITDRCGIPDRRITEQVIEEHLGRFPWPLVAGGSGYYIPTQAKDINDYLSNLHKRHRKMQLREETTVRKAMASGYFMDDGVFVDPPTRQPELFSGG